MSNRSADLDLPEIPVGAHLERAPGWVPLDAPIFPPIPLARPPNNSVGKVRVRAPASNDERASEQARYLIPPELSASSEVRVEVRQQWEGAVESIENGEFEAILTDLTDKSRPAEYATFSVDELSDDDRRLLQVGAVFYWTIGYETDRRDGGRRGFTAVRFRRIPAWSRREVDAMYTKADALLASLEDDDTTLIASAG